jgi:electron transport complex protein RnfG
MRNIISLGVTLAIFCAVAAGALAATDQVTTPIIQAQQELAVQNALKEVLPKADNFEELTGLELDKEVQTVYQAKAGGQDAGIVALVNPTGYGGPISVMVGIEEGGNVSAIKILSHTETPGLGAKITEPAFQEQFAGKSTETEFKVNKDGGEIDAITAATISSRAVAKGVNYAIEVYNNVR